MTPGTGGFLYFLPTPDCPGQEANPRAPKSSDNIGDYLGSWLGYKNHQSLICVRLGRREQLPSDGILL